MAQVPRSVFTTWPGRIRVASPTGLRLKMLYPADVAGEYQTSTSLSEVYPMALWPPLWHSAQHGRAQYPPPLRPTHLAVEDPQALGKRPRHPPPASIVWGPRTAVFGASAHTPSLRRLICHEIRRESDAHRDICPKRVGQSKAWHTGSRAIVLNTTSGAQRTVLPGPKLRLKSEA